MNTECPTFNWIYLSDYAATHPLARPVGRLPLSRLVAGLGLLPRCFAAATHPDAPSGASNCGF